MRANNAGLSAYSYARKHNVNPQVYTHTHTHTHTRTHIYMHACMHTSTCMHAYIHTSTCIRKCAQTHVNPHVHTQTCTHTHARARTHTHTHTGDKTAAQVPEDERAEQLLCLDKYHIRDARRRRGRRAGGDSPGRGGWRIARRWCGHCPCWCGRCCGWSRVAAARRVWGHLDLWRDGCKARVARGWEEA